MDPRLLFCEISDKAEYISEVSMHIYYDKLNTNQSVSIAETAELMDILQKLSNIADCVDEYHNWDDEEDDNHDK